MALASLMSPRRGLRALSLFVLLGALLLPLLPSRSATAAGAAITLSPTSGGVGTTINVKGTGFTTPGATSVLTCWQSEPGCGQPGNTGGTVVPLNPDGSFISAEFVTISAACLAIAGTTEAACTNPPNCTSCTLIVTDSCYSQACDKATATFNYVKTAAPPAPTTCSAPVQPVFPTTLAPGQSQPYSAGGFAVGPGVTLSFSLSGPGTPPSPSSIPSLSPSADANCTVNVTIQIPAGAPPGNYILTASGPKFGGNGTQTWTSTFTIPPATGSIQGHVRSSAPGNAGIAGATVSAGGQQATSGPDGSYLLANVPAGQPGQPVPVSASASGYSSGTGSGMVAGGQTTTVDLTLTPSAASTCTSPSATASGGAYTGQGFAPNTTPVLTVLPPTKGLSVTNISPATSACVVVATINIDPSAPSGDYYVHVASGTAFNGGALPPDAKFTVAATTGDVSGQVRDQNGNRLSGVTVTGGGQSATTNANGNYTLSGLLPGSVTITATSTNPAGSGSVISDVVAGASVPLQDITIAPPTGSIEGMVLDPNGAPVSGATVTTSGKSTTTDANGHYTLAGLPVGDITIEADKQGTGGGAMFGTVAAGQVTGIQDITLTPTVGTVRGRVLDGSGQGVSGASVSSGGASTTSDANGNYTLPGLPVGSVTITATKPGIGSGSITPLLGNDGVPIDGANITLVLVTGGIQGHVRTQNGDLVNGATVSGGGKADTTNADGLYALNGVPAGPVTVTATSTSPAGSGSVSTTVQGGTIIASALNDIIITTDPTMGGVQGRVLDSTGVPAPGESVFSLDQSAVSDDNGFYTLGKLPAGPVTISVSGPAGNGSLDITVAGGTLTTLQDITTDGTVAGGGDFPLPPGDEGGQDTGEAF